jgi:hypothetical protein
MIILTSALRLTSKSDDIAPPFSSAHIPLFLIRRRILTSVQCCFVQYGILYHEAPEFRPQEPKSAFRGLSTAELPGTSIEGEEDANEQAEDAERVQDLQVSSTL